MVNQWSSSGSVRRQSGRLALEEVGLSGGTLDRSWHRLSGGKKQRLVIARALVVEPKLLILDESLTGLDTEAQIITLLRHVRHGSGSPTFVVAQDLQLAAGLADEIAVLDHGRLVERAPVTELFAAPEARSGLRALPPPGVRRMRFAIRRTLHSLLLLSCL
jgi:ABC-type dipeptide/oligopeptide/nickel transport system ATPase subunit